MRRVARKEERYAPGWTRDALTMMRSRSSSRFAFAAPHIADGMRVLDIGCGPGTITAAIAETVGPNGEVLGVDVHEGQIEEARRLPRVRALRQLSFEAGSIYRLLVEDRSFDMVFSHGLFEHLARPDEALVELKRVVKPGGLVAISSSDWGGAEIDPLNEDVTAALRGHFHLRRKAGGDPYAGGSLPSLLQAGGWDLLDTSSSFHADLTYGELARYVKTRLEAATRQQEPDELLADALEAARRWSRAEDGTFRQQWVACVARRP